LAVSHVGLGLGGKSRVGANQGLSPKEQCQILRGARDAGINYFDTAEAYGNESRISQAFTAKEREGLVISSKFTTDGLKAAGLRDKLEATLRKIGLSHLDVYLGHAVTPGEYVRLREELVPALQDLQKEGKIRYFGLSERFEIDPGHAMLSQAAADGCWDVLMVGYSLLNPSARARVFPLALENGCGLIGMFAVRRVLARNDLFLQTVQDLARDGRIDSAWARSLGPLPGWLRRHGIGSLVELAYRYAVHTSELSTVLVGTGNLRHLHDNIRSVGKGPLPDELLQELHHHFGHLDHLTGS
jgi:aryl-alcohol dehydrogenase-like predicted oxidoreductase